MRIVVLVRFFSASEQERKYVLEALHLSPEWSGVSGNSILTLHEDCKMKLVELCQTIFTPCHVHDVFYVRDSSAARSYQLCCPRSTPARSGI